MKQITCQPAITLLVALLISFGVIGCQSVATFHVGHKVPVEESVFLHDGGPHQGSWESFEVVIPYSYEQRVGTLEIAATARLGEHYRSIYHQLNRFDLYLYFLDESSTVLATAALASSFRQSTNDPINFRRTLAIPVGAVAFSFGYQGGVSDLEDFVSFDKLPYR